MSISKNSIKDFLWRHGWYLRRKSGLAFGIDVFADLHRLGLSPPKVVADIGAHVGQSSSEFARRWRDAQILAFEPVSANFQRLTRAVADLNKVRCFNHAVGDREGEMTISLDPDSSQRHRMVPLEGLCYMTEKVRTVTLDQFFSTEPPPEFLKIDVEGYEIPVLVGARRLLGSGVPQAIFIEATLDQTDQVHTRLELIQNVLGGHGFSIAAIYDQAIFGQPKRLAFFNALFIK